MKLSRKVLIPAVIVAVISIALVIYALYTMPQHVPGEHPRGIPGERPPEGSSLKEIFNNVGNVAILCGAVSYLWFIFKKRLTSPSQPVKKLGKVIYKFHSYTGWAALLLTVVHGVYYIAKVDEHGYLTGIAAFLLLLSLAVYGWLLKRYRNKFMRSAHFLLCNLWVAALLIHAGGSAVLMTGATLLIWIAVWAVERSIKRKTLQTGHQVEVG